MCNLKNLIYICTIIHNAKTEKIKPIYDVVFSKKSITLSIKYQK